MTLYQKLQNVRSEEDVKDIYIKALGLKGYSSCKLLQAFIITCASKGCKMLCK